MRRPSTRLPTCLNSATIVNNVFLFAFVLSFFSSSVTATTTSTSTTQSPARTTRPTSTTKPYYILPFFLPDSEPLSLVASVIHQTTIITTTIIRPTATITSLSLSTLISNRDGESEQEEDIILQINCPSALTPENEACRSAKIYPAVVTGRRGVKDDGGNLAHTNVWKGETTYLVGDDTTTTWTCWQGMSLRTGVPTPIPTRTPTLPTEILNPEITPGPVQTGPAARNAVGEVVPYAQCVSTIVMNQGSQIRFVTRRYDECYFYRHMVPIVVGIGDGLLNERGEQEVENMNSGWDSKLSRLGCDTADASRTLWAGSVTDAAVVAAATETVKSSTGTKGPRGVSMMLRDGVMGIAWTTGFALMGSWIHVGLCVGVL